jgi:hypothetical protein
MCQVHKNNFNMLTDNIYSNILQAVAYYLYFNRNES